MVPSLALGFSDLELGAVPGGFDRRSTILTIRVNCRALGIWPFCMVEMSSADSGDSGTYRTSLSNWLLVRGPAAFMNL